MLLFSCAKEMEQPEQIEKPAREGKTYTLTVTAGKGERPDTKALGFDGTTLKATWAIGEEVSVYKGEDLLGTLSAGSAGTKTTLSGSVSGDLSMDDVLTLRFLSPDYASQDGTLDYIAAHCDYAVADVTVTSVVGTTVTTTSATFENRQAIVKFRLRNADNTADLAARPLVVTAGLETLTVTPASATSELYVAVPAIAVKPLLLKATVGETLYLLNKSGLTLEAGKYYAITARLSSAIVVHNESELLSAVSTDNAHILFANDIPITALVNIADSRTITIDLNGFTLDRGCTSRDWDHGGQVFAVRTGTTLNLSGGTLTGGWGGNGGALDIENGATVNLTNVTVTGNHADDRGGGISIQSGGTLNMTGGAITDNVSRDRSGIPAGGGGLFIYEGSTAMLTGVTISGNETEVYGGGGIDNFGTLTLEGCTITGNTSKANGAGIWTSAASTLNMRGTNIIYDNWRTNALRSNLYLADGTVITITGALEGSRVYVGMETLGKFTSGYSTYNDGHPAGFFTADKGAVIGMRLVDGEGLLEDVIPAGGVYYVERSWNETAQRVEAAYHTLESHQYTTLTGGSGDTYLDPGWYAVKGSDVEYKDFLYMDGGGEYHLILCDGASLKAEFFIVNSPNVLHIHGQANDTGKMSNTFGSSVVYVHKYHAGLGGYYDKENGTIVIHGGDIDVHGGDAGPGIGNRSHKTHGEPITIYGGTVHAKGGIETGSEGGGGGAGIGGGWNGDCGIVNIYGGSVYATGRGNSAGGAGIGSGSFAKNSGTITIYGGYVEATGDEGGAGIGSGYGTSGADVTIHGGTVKAYGKAAGPGIGTGVTKDDPIPYTGSLTVTGGKVYAYGASMRGAGIGGGYDTNGSYVTVSGGYVYAEGGKYAAGIGSGCEYSSSGSHGGTLIVTGGYVEAHGGEDGAGIGGGEDSDGATVNINGGEVRAYGSYGGAGIGGGEDGNGGNVTITGGTVIAQAGKDDTGYRAIGPGLGSDNYGSLSLGDILMVSSERMALEVERHDMCWYRTRVRIEPCTHSGYESHPQDCIYHKH